MSTTRPTAGLVLVNEPDLFDAVYPCFDYDDFPRQVQVILLAAYLELERRGHVLRRTHRAAQLFGYRIFVHSAGTWRLHYLHVFDLKQEFAG